MGLKLSVIAVDVFLEKYKTRIFVGTLKKEKNQFLFIYDDRYLRTQNIIPLGPELPLTKKEFRSDVLFPSFEDRIPSRQNPAYPEYCKAMGINTKENNPLILLSTIGKRGPSSFVFEPHFERSFSVQDLIEFRKALGLTTREFAEIFEIPQASLNALERNRSSGKDLLKRLELIIKFPDVALYLLIMNGGFISFDKWQNAKDVLERLKS
ncbi:MAG: HipA N-terminal domain-containing protein [Chlamydiae bacterium]|nr:HipA N-terminal domain-containing protein [Chlamydiota bacterium]